ncbi:LuxR family transcriptional regulator [Asticcacaulis sp. 201]|uniref:helix-turn-helix transcriptional regulator n=1 Tax=Asticcacaulis sp. 201 TaxID=3028787 RepID=UPI0029162101|nr:LuxR family transcriptional regulator [Asticcacaulis sp. 201]MDV6332664.1 LuxR family transcriptional regulator [Asticcacaulis sp. 201]
MFDAVHRYQFEDFVTDTHRATADDELFALLKRAVAQHGYDRISLWVIDDPDLPQRVHGRGVLHNFPEDLRTYYKENECDRYDPIMLALRTRTTSLDWEAHERQSDYKPVQTRLYDVARSGGLHNGISTPMWGRSGLLASLGLASTERRDATYANPDLIAAVTAQFYLSYKRLNAHALPSQSPSQALSQSQGITPKQAEILSWVAAGKTDQEIADILCISRNTVDTHMRQIFARLGAHSRVTAVVRGIAEGVIRP